MWNVNVPTVGVIVVIVVVVELKYCIKRFDTNKVEIHGPGYIDYRFLLINCDNFLIVLSVSSLVWIYITQGI